MKHQSPEHIIQSITVAGTPLEVSAAMREGGPELLVLIHGLGCAKESFRHVWEQEDFHHLSLLAIDLPGCGNSSKPPDFSYSMEDTAYVCAQVIQAHNRDGLHIAAHSMGCAVGLLLPHNILRSLLSFSCLEGNLIAEDCAMVSRKASQIPLEEFESEFLPKLKAKVQARGRNRLFLDSALPRAFYRSAISLVQWSDSDELLQKFKGLSCKKAYFYGDRNTSMPILSQLGGIHTIEISRSGHFMMNDNPDEFYAKLREFLED